MEWHWDERKARSNVAKHGIPFELAVKVFNDPFHLTQPDTHSDNDRWHTMGRINVSTLLVVHTFFDDDSGGRIISARKATALERKNYERNKQ